MGRGIAKKHHVQRLELALPMIQLKMSLSVVQSVDEYPVSCEMISAKY